MDQSHCHRALPTAEAHRLIEPLRTSPAANTPSILVSRRNGSRERSCQSSSSAESSSSLPVRTKPRSSSSTVPWSQPVLASAPMKTKSAREVVDHLHFALENDYKIVLGVARPKKDIPDLRLPLLPVAPEDLDLVFPQRRGPRTADLIHSIIHVATSSLAPI